MPSRQAQKLSAVLEQQRPIAEILRVISRSPHDEQLVFKVIAQRAARLCKAKFVVLYRYDGSLIHFAAHHGLSPRALEEMERIYPLKPGQATTVARSIFRGAVAEIPDTSADPHYAAGLLASLARARSIIAVPMMKNGWPIGSIAVARSKPGRFATPYIKLLKTFADQAVIAIENARLFAEAQQRNRELSATGDVLKMISRSPIDVQPVFDAVAESAARLCEAHDAIIFVKKGDELAIGAHYGPIPIDWTSRKISRDWFTGRAVVDRVPMHVHDLLAEGDEFPESRADAMRQGHRTILAVPLLSEGEAIGALVIRRREVRPFSERQINLLHTFSDQSVIAIKNVRQFEEIGKRNRELSEALEQQTATSAVLRVIAASPTDIGPVLDTVAESAGRLCQAQDTLIYLREEDRLSVRAHYGPMQHEHHEWPLDRGLASARAIIERAPVHVHDLLQAADEFPASYQLALEEGQRTLLAVPLLRDEEAIGALVVRRDYVEPFSQRQVDLLRTFADQAVIAIQNAQLFDEVQHRNRELTATSEVLRVISRSPTDVQPVLDTVVESAGKLCDAYDTAIFLREGDVLTVAAHHGVIALDVPRLPLERSLVTSRAVLDRAPVHVRDLSAEEDEYPQGSIMARRLGFKTILAIPLLRQGEAIGALMIRRDHVEPFTQKQIDLVKTFADQAVIAIENVRLFDQVRARTHELQQSLEYQTATSEVLNVISRSPTELQPVLDVIVETAVRLCDADFGTIARERDGAFVRTGQYGSTREFKELMLNSPVETTRGSITGRTLVEGKVVHILDARTDPEYTFRVAQEHEEIRTGLGVPLLRGGTPIGAIALVRRTVKPFSEKQIELVTTFADQAVIAIENARLFEEVQARTGELTEALEYQTATSDVLSVISRSPSQAQPVLDTIVATAGRLCQSEYAFIFMRKEDGKYHLQAGHLAEPALLSYLQANPVTPSRGTASGRAVLERRTIHIPDGSADPDYTWVEWINLSGTQTFLGVPLLRDGDPIGVIAAARKKQTGPFTERQIELITTFADQAVIAIENARLFDEVQARTAELTESLKQQTATADVLKVISRSAFDLKTVLQTLVESAARLCDADRATITRQIDGVFYDAESYGLSPEVMDLVRIIPIRPDRGSVAGRALLDGKVVQIADVRADPDYTFSPEVQRLAGYRTMLGVPMLREGTPIGVLSLARPDVRPFSEKQTELVSTFADQAAIAIENARLFEAVQARTAELTESLQRQTATADVLKVISRSAFDLKTVLQTLVESAARLCDAEKGTITREVEGKFYRAEAYGFSPEFMEHVRAAPVEIDKGSASGRALLEGKVIHIADIEKDPEYTFIEAKRLGGFRTVIGVPMMREGKAIGVLALTRSEVRPFTEKQIELVSTFADQAAIAIENVRLFESVEARTRELARSLEDLRAAQDRLIQTEKLASLGQLTAGIAHEIKNPLNFVNNFSALSLDLVEELRELIGESGVNERRRADIGELMTMLKGNLDKVSQHGRRADSIVKNMLLHSRQGLGEHRLANVNAIVEESLNLAYHGARAERQGFNITLEKSLDPEAGEVDLYPQEITRVLLNLISNGFYATIKRNAEMNEVNYEPTLLASTRNLGDRVEIRIRDNGTGISTEVKEKIFVPFFTTKPAGEGTGLGLSLSYDIIVKQHAGTIDVDSKIGEFTEFRIVLPRAAASLAQSGGPT
jgi:GAF domain-containing protein